MEATAARTSVVEDKIEKFYEISKVDLDKHLFLKENAEIVLAENEGLKEKINNLRNQNTIIHEDLSKKIREMKKDVITARNQVDDMKYVSIIMTVEVAMAWISCCFAFYY